MTKDSAVDHKITRAMLHPRYWATWLSLVFLAILAWVPVRARDRFAAWIAPLIVRIAHKQCDVARVNLTLCFPEKSEAEREDLLVRCVRIGVIGFLGLGEPVFLPSQMFLKRIHPIGWEHVTEALKQNRPIIFMVPHTWTIDACGLYLPGMGLTMCTMMHSANNLVYDWYLNLQRVRFGGKVYERSASLKPIIKDMRSGYNFFYLPDQDHGPEASIFAPLFNVPKATLPALPKLARLSNAIVISALAIYNEQEHRYEWDICPPMEPYPTQDLVQDVTTMNQEIELLLRKHPEQYMWFLKFFRTMPDGTRRHYHSDK